MCGSAVSVQLDNDVVEFSTSLRDTAKTIADAGGPKLVEDFTFNLINALSDVVVDYLDTYAGSAPVVDGFTASILESIGGIAGDVTGLVVANRLRESGEYSAAYGQPVGEKQA